MDILRFDHDQMEGGQVLVSEHKAYFLFWSLAGLGFCVYLGALAYYVKKK